MVVHSQGHSDEERVSGHLKKILPLPHPILGSIEDEVERKDQEDSKGRIERRQVWVTRKDRMIVKTGFGEHGRTMM